MPPPYPRTFSEVNTLWRPYYKQTMSVGRCYKKDRHNQCPQVDGESLLFKSPDCSNHQAGNGNADPNAEKPEWMCCPHRDWDDKDVDGFIGYLTTVGRVA